MEDDVLVKEYGSNKWIKGHILVVEGVALKQSCIRVQLVLVLLLMKVKEDTTIQ